MGDSPVADAGAYTSSELGGAGGGDLMTQVGISAMSNAISVHVRT